MAKELRPRREEPREGPMKIVSTLLCHAHVDMALVCLGSLRSSLREPFRLRIHDDGTLAEEDRLRLAVLGSPEFVSRREADERIEPVIAGHPRSLAFRRSNPLALKLLDACLLAEGELLYCDSDVLFLRAVEGLFDAGGPQASVFMRDEQNAYSLRSWQLARHRLRIPARLNTGLFRFPRDRFDLDLVEWYLGRREMHFAPVWMEQTAWALVAGNAETAFFEPRRFRLARTGEAPRPTDADDDDLPAALHFVSSSRAGLPAWRGRVGSPLRRVGAERAEPCLTLDLAAEEARRRWRRWVAD
jgi:hypothetical protein